MGSGVRHVTLNERVVDGGGVNMRGAPTKKTEMQTSSPATRQHINNSLIRNQLRNKIRSVNISSIQTTTNRGSHIPYPNTPSYVLKHGNLTICLRNVACNNSKLQGLEQPIIYELLSTNCNPRKSLTPVLHHPLTLTV